MVASSDDDAAVDAGSGSLGPQPPSRVAALVGATFLLVTIFAAGAGQGTAHHHLDPAVFAEPLAKLRADIGTVASSLQLIGDGARRAGEPLRVAVLHAANPSADGEPVDVKGVKAMVAAEAKTLKTWVTSIKTDMLSEAEKQSKARRQNQPFAQAGTYAAQHGFADEYPAEPVEEMPGGPYVAPPDPWSEFPKAQQMVKRRDAVVDAMLHAWNGYTKHAWGYDELTPRSKQGKNWNDDPNNSLGLTIIDALTTLHIMGLKDQLDRALRWVKHDLKFDGDTGVSAFESTIRVVGSLLSVYELTGEKDAAILAKAKELMDKLLWAYNTTTGIPHQTINLHTHHHNNPDWSGGASVLSEFGTVQLELRTLSFHTGDPIYDQKATHLMSVVRAKSPKDGLCPCFISVVTANWMTDHISVGALGDSFYEYLLKQWLLTGRTEDTYLHMFRTAAQGIVDKLVFKSRPSEYVYIAEYRRMEHNHKMDELACFAGGMLALGAQEFANDTSLRDSFMETAKGLGRTCYNMFHRQKSGLAPEYVEFPGGVDFINGNGYYLLRPETMETMFYLWRFTGDQQWRDWGWDIFRAIDRWCKVDTGGYAGIKEVNVKTPIKDDLQQSFFLAETLKYAYLLFADNDVLDLNQWVFNTEAHPLKIRKRDPLDVWRAYEEAHGSVPWRAPKLPGVEEVETEKMRRDRLAGKAKQPRSVKDIYGEEIDGQADDEGMPFDPRLGMEGVKRAKGANAYTNAYQQQQALANAQQAAALAQQQQQAPAVTPAPKPYRPPILRPSIPDAPRSGGGLKAADAAREAALKRAKERRKQRKNDDDLD